MKRENFDTRRGFILAAAGSAIGLGNIWRFPYLVGEYGGFGFIFLYILILLFICNPLMVSEIALGRTAKSNFIDAYRIVGEKSGVKHLAVWQFLGGGMSAAGLFMILSFYFLVAGWVLYYLFEAVNGNILFAKPEVLPETFSRLTKDFPLQYACAVAFLLLTALVVIAGVRGGIEKVCTYLMPLLFVIFVLMSVQALLLDGAGAGIRFLLYPDWKSLGFIDGTVHWSRLGEVFMAALGQAFISLSLGYGILMVYGSYLSARENLFTTVKFIELFDTTAALLSAVIIIPAIFSAGLEPASGPGLTFISLPMVFQQMPFGQVWAVLFYLLLMLATLTSTISVFEGLNNLLMEKLNMSRVNSVFLTVLVSGLGMTAVALSFSGTWDIQVAGRNLFELFDWLSSTYTAAIVSITIAVFVGYRTMKTVIHNIRRSAPVSLWFTRYFLISLRYIAPLFIGLLLVFAIKTLFGL